jgi:CheY-like chemotaxis protein
VGTSPSGSLGVDTGGLQLVCECGWAGCRETVTLTPGALEAFRRAARPVLAPGHGPADEARQSVGSSTDDAHAVTAHSAQLVRRAKVLAVDDSEIFLSVADSVVSATTGLRLVGTAASGEEALRLIPDLQPDLIMLDVHMPGIDGIETARIIRGESPETVVVLVSAEPEGLATGAQSAGAVAVLGKVDLAPDMLDELWLKHGSPS